MSYDEEKHLLREERAGMEDLMQDREQDIEELNAEIKTLKEALIDYVQDVKDLKAENRAMELNLAKMKLPQTKKMCPFMSQSHVSSCRTDCRMWKEGNQHIPPYCTIEKGIGFLQNIGMGE